MKKETFVLLLLILLSIMALSAQSFKIGTIQVNETIFNAYIVDCYTHPDTIHMKSVWDGVPKQKGFASLQGYDYDKREAEAKSFNEWLVKNSIDGKMIIRRRPYKAYYDSVWSYPSGLMWTSAIQTKAQRDKMRGKLKRVELVPAGEVEDYTGLYVVPRKPSEEDFVKWYNIHKIRIYFQNGPNGLELIEK